MRIEHLALYVQDLEGMRAFYEHYFFARAASRYHNPDTGLETYFLSFEGEGRLELMTRPNLGPGAARAPAAGYAHLALSRGSREAVDAWTARLRGDGFSVVSGPRVTGDGYYERCVLDPEGNRIDLTD